MAIGSVFRMHCVLLLVDTLTVIINGSRWDASRRENDLSFRRSIDDEVIANENQFQLMHTTGACKPWLVFLSSLIIAMRCLTTKLHVLHTLPLTAVGSAGYCQGSERVCK